MSRLSPVQIQQIQALVRQCGQQSQQLAAENFQVYEKGIEDYVTDVDRTLDRQLAAGFANLFPQEGIITEENTQSWRIFAERAANSSRLWFIDPLDGTEDFIHKKPHYAVMVGLLQQYQPVAGWVYAPVFDQMYYGGAELGLFQMQGDRPPEPLVPKEPSPPSADFCPILLGYKDQRRYGAKIQVQIPAAQFDCIGSFGLKVLRVIMGQAGLYVYLNRRVKLWDTTGPIAMARAAGLVCCDLAGNPLQFTPDAVAADSLTHHQSIVIGWASYVEALRSPLETAVAEVQSAI